MKKIEKNGKIFSITFIFVLFLSIMPSLFVNNIEGTLIDQVGKKSESVGFPQSAEIHSPIFIDGNTALAAFCEGNGSSGTAANPYIIEDYVIDASSINGIEIHNVNVYLKIQNCTISNGDNGINVHNCFNISNCFWNHMSQNFISLFGNQYIVFYTDTNTAPFFINTGTILRNIKPRLYR